MSRNYNAVSVNLLFSKKKAPQYLVLAPVLWIWIWIRIRIKLKGGIRIRIFICIKVTRMIRIRIKVMRIPNTA
jgi:hypothetical protein